MFTRLIATLFGTTTRTPIRNANRCRLNAEALEAREVPASFIWTAQYSEDGTVAANWRNDFDRGPSSRIPMAGDDVNFTYVWAEHGTTLYGTDCLGFGLASGSFHSVTVADGYTHTVELATGFQTQILILADGAISQPVSGTDITVTDNFVWTKGALNSSSHLSDVTLSGATGLIAPHAAGTVTLGSNLSVVNAAVLNIYAGTVSCINDGMTFTVADQGGVRADPGSGNETIVKSSGGAINGLSLYLSVTGSVEVVSGRYNFDGVGSNNGGRLTLGGGTDMRFSSNASVFPHSYVQHAGVTQLYGNSLLRVGTKMVVFGGKLSTLASGSTSDAYIVTPTLHFTGGDVFIGEGTPHVFGTLAVLGDVIWSGGFYHPFVQDLGPNIPWQSDLWKSTGTFVVRDQAALAPAAIDFPHNPVMPSSGSEWLILEAGTVLDQGGAPSYDHGVWDIRKQGMSTTRWYLKAV